MLGEEVYNLSSNGSTIEIDMNRFVPGTYIIRLEDKEKKILGKKKNNKIFKYKCAINSTFNNGLLILIYF